jgi:hypothetical protein
MQNSAGNAAVCARLRAEATTPAAPVADQKSTAGEVEEGGTVLVDARTSSPASARTSGDEVQRSPMSWLKQTFGKKKPVVSAPQNGRSTVAVTVPTNVRGTSSPAGMADRIPPRVNTLAHVDVKNLQEGNTPVDISVEGSGGGNGTVTVDGGPTKT